MQTFLPYESFRESLTVLDYKRLGKQRLEALQIIRILENPTALGYRTHPAVHMWTGYVDCLKVYYNMTLQVWLERGYKNTLPFYPVPTYPRRPWWSGHPALHWAMRARLIFKKPDFYGPLFPGDQNFNACQYFWPVNSTQTFKLIPTKLK